MNARVLGDLPADDWIRVADEMSGCVVAALLHGATLADLREDLHWCLTVAYDLDVTAGDCEQLLLELREADATGRATPFSGSAGARA